MSMDNHGGMVSTEEKLIRPPELSGSSTSSHLVTKQYDRATDMNESDIPKSLFQT
jgi:hypothetical protein